MLKILSLCTLLKSRFFFFFNEERLVILICRLQRSSKLEQESSFRSDELEASHTQQKAGTSVVYK